MRGPTLVRRRRVQVVKTGDVAQTVRAVVGDYDRWFVPALQAAGVAWEVVPVHLGAPLAGGADAVIITGSAQSLVTPSPWMHRLADAMRRRIEADAPTLGVCFGHQLLAFAQGTPVIRNALGREIGTVEVKLTAAGRRDPLFAGCPDTFSVQATHEDVPARLPEGAVALAENPFGLQAMALGRAVRGVQFHPELTPEGMLRVIEARSATLDQEGVATGMRPGERPARLRAGISHAPHARRVLANFLKHLV